MSAGELFESVRFEKQGASGSDGGGGVLEAWTTQFSRRAGYTHLRGGEAVLAGRLEGRHTTVIRVRRSDEVLTVTTEWRIIDTRRGTVWNIRDIEPETDRGYVSFTCESGVAT